MAEYRVFCVDDDGHVVLGKEVVAANDVSNRFCNDFQVELWQQTRLIARVKKGNAPLNVLDHWSL